MTKQWRRVALAAGMMTVCALAFLAAGCGGGGGSSSNAKGGASMPQSIGKGEGKLTMVAWEGYLQPETFVAHTL